MEKVKKIKTLFLVNIVLAVVLFVGGIILCFLPATSMKETEEGFSSKGISAADILNGDCEAEVLMDGESTGLKVDLELAFIDDKVVTKLGGMQGIMELLMIMISICGAASILGLAIGMAMFYSAGKKKAKDGSLVIKHHVQNKFFVHPVRLLNTINTFFALFFIAPWIIQLVFKGDDLQFAGYAIVIAVIYFVIVLLAESIILQIVKKELDSMTDEEVAGIFAGQTLYAEAIAVKNAIEARETENENATTYNEDATEQIKKYYDLYTQGIITEEEFNEKKKELLENNK